MSEARSAVLGIAPQLEELKRIGVVNSDISLEDLQRASDIVGEEALRRFDEEQLRENRNIIEETTTPTKIELISTLNTEFAGTSNRNLNQLIAFLSKTIAYLDGSKVLPDTVKNVFDSDSVLLIIDRICQDQVHSQEYQGVRYFGNSDALNIVIPIRGIPSESDIQLLTISLNIYKNEDGSQRFTLYSIV